MSVISDLFSSLWSFLKYPVYGILIIAGIFVVILIGFFISHLAKGDRIKKGKHKKPKKEPLLKKIFYTAPKMFIDDFFAQDPDYFRFQGLVLYTGKQGNGKTIAMVHDALKMQEEYPLAKCISNIKYVKQDRKLTHWSQLVNYNNGIYGVIAMIDEIHNWFSCKQSKDFPPQMLEVVTQNRKNRRIIMGTSQNYYQPAKDIRAQCTVVRKCVTIAKVFTIVHEVIPTLDSDGTVQSWKHSRYYCFAHTKELRDAYDTYEVVKSLAKSGFVENNKTENNVVVNNTFKGGKK